jgi:hypothetical protein
LDYFREMTFKNSFAAAWRISPLCLLGALSTTGCRTAPPLPPANLKQPGWTLHEGQAVWSAKRDAPEIAGEILVATHADGRAFVQFSKTPFPFVIARTEQDAWQIEMPARNKRSAGHCPPPTRVIWFQLSGALSGQPPLKPWAWQINNNQWRLENRSTSESLQGYFTS